MSYCRRKRIDRNWRSKAEIRTCL